MILLTKRVSLYKHSIDDGSDTNWEHVLKKFRDNCEPRKNEVGLFKDINSGNVTNARGDC